MICGLAPFRTRDFSFLHSVKTYFTPERGDRLSAAPSNPILWVSCLFPRR